MESKYPNFPGLNLSYEVRSGSKAPHTIDKPKMSNVDCFILEAQIVNITDEITYTAHDVDDAIRARILSDGLVKHVQI